MGQPDEAAWPYSADLSDPASWRPPGSVTPLFTCESNSCAPGLDSIRDHLTERRPVVIGVFLSKTYRFPENWSRLGTEVLLAPDRNEPIDRNEGHAMVVVGHGLYSGDPIMLLRNSWGAGWGNNGHAWVREDCLAPRMVGAFAIEKGDGDVLQSDVGGAHAGTRLA
ncbi:MAG: C1 family peptidase [Thalassobaculum sp.]